MKLYQKLAREIERFHRCTKTGMHIAAQSAKDEIDVLMAEMPSGSGWNCGTKLDLSESSASKIRLTGSFHHMDEQGGYDGWTDHAIIVTPCLALEYSLRITGRDRNGIKEYLTDLFSNVLDMEMDGATVK